MLLGLNGATTMYADLETDIRVASAAGYDLIEIWAAKLETYLTRHAPADLAALLRQHKLTPYSINSIENINLRLPADFENIKQTCRRLSAVAQAIGCPYLVVVPSPAPEGATRAEIRTYTVAALNELADIAAAHSVQLAFEMLGPRQCSVHTLHDAWEIVRRVDRPDVGLVLDTFHFYLGASLLSSIAEIDPAKLFIFHINDAESGPRATLTDAQRLLPGDGVIPLAAICRALHDIGYGKMVSIELFRPEYWDWDPLKLAQEAKAKTERIVHSVWA